MNDQVNVEQKHSGDGAELPPRPALVCRVCGTEERLTDFGGVRYTTIAPFNRLCFTCLTRIAVCH